MIKIDKKDKILISQLAKDSRTSHTQLGKLAHLSKSSIGHRIGRLQTQNVLSQFTAIINFRSIQVYTNLILIRFNEIVSDAMRNYFATHHNVTWAITLSGQWDILVEIAFSSPFENEQILLGIRNAFPGTISNVELLSQTRAIRVEHLVRDFHESKNTEFTNSAATAATHVVLDQTNKLLLRALTINSASPLVAIAKHAKITVNTAHERLQNLKTSGVLVGLVAEINLASLGYTEYIYKLKLDNLTQDTSTKLINEIKVNKNVKYACIDITGENILIHFAFLEPSGIDAFSSGLRKRFSDSIATQEYYLIKEQLKFDLFPEGIANTTRER